MSKAQKRIEQCIIHGDKTLNLEECDLKELPANLPSSLRVLYCGKNCLERLPVNLPPYLNVLDCSYNLIKSLPANLPTSLLIFRCSRNYLEELPLKLPDYIVELDCSSNKIKQLPYLPVSLEYLECSDNCLKQLPQNLLHLKLLNCNNNQITELPLNLKHEHPTVLNQVDFTNNKYLHIPKKCALRFNIKQTPNYNHMASNLQRIWKIKKCKKIIIQMINDNTNVLFGCFQSYGDFNIVHIVVNYVY